MNVHLPVSRQDGAETVPVKLTVNGSPVAADIAPWTTLLDFLRETMRPIRPRSAISAKSATWRPA